MTVLLNWGLQMKRTVPLQRLCHWVSLGESGRSQRHWQWWNLNEVWLKSEEPTGWSVSQNSSSKLLSFRIRWSWRRWEREVTSDHWNSTLSNFNTQVLLWCVFNWSLVFFSTSKNYVAVTVLWPGIWFDYIYHKKLLIKVLINCMKIIWRKIYYELVKCSIWVPEHD